MAGSSREPAQRAGPSGGHGATASRGRAHTRGETPQWPELASTRMWVCPGFRRAAHREAKDGAPQRVEVLLDGARRIDHPWRVEHGSPRATLGPWQGTQSDAAVVPAGVRVRPSAHTVGLRRPYPHEDGAPLGSTVPTETVEIVDPTHALYGLRLTLIAIAPHQRLGRVCRVWLAPGVERSVPDQRPAIRQFLAEF
jgi:hypothetical protein